MTQEVLYDTAVKLNENRDKITYVNTRPKAKATTYNALPVMYHTILRTNLYYTEASITSSKKQADGWNAQGLLS